MAEVGVRLLRGVARDARPARRQGRQHRRDEADRRPGARAGRLHDHDRGVRRLHARRRRVPGRARGAGRRGAVAASRSRPGSASATTEDPLLVSVRSGARESMPGMMDTVLNLGLNDRSVAGLIASTQNERFGWDSYRRFVQMFGNVVRGIDGDALRGGDRGARRDSAASRCDTELDAGDLRDLTDSFKRIFEVQTGEEFPQDPREQLRQAIRAVFDSWNGARAVEYRRQNHIPDDWGTAVNVQQMVFGNKGDTSASGVAFTPRRDDRRAPAVRRLPPERAGRGRRVRRAEHARPGRAGRADARGPRPADGDHARARASLQGHAGRRVHDRGRDALHAPDTQREAAGAGGRARGGRPGRGGPADEGGGADARRCREARRAAPSDVRPELRVPAAGARGAGIAGGGQGRDRLHGRGGGRPGRRRATP